jgi:PAS domain S-box-containing protein
MTKAKGIPLRLAAWEDNVDDATYRLLVDSVRDYAIFLLDPDGFVCSWNKGAERIKGYQAGEIIGRHFSQFYPQEKNEQGWPEHELAVARDTGRFEDEGWRLRQDGSRFWANVVLTRIDHPDGTLRGFAKITRDLTERREQEEKLHQSEERFRLMVENVRDFAIFMLDSQGRVASWNRGAQKIKGYAPEEIIGQHFSAFYPEEVVADGWPERELQYALAEGRVEDEGWRLRKDGTRFWASVVITAIYDDEGRHVGFAKVVRDLTESRRVQALEDEGQKITTFLAMLGHELRNPLAPIANAVSIMRNETIESESLRFCRDVIGRQVVQITRLVDDLLDVSRITSGKIRLELSVLDLRPVLAEALEAVEAEAQRRAHELRNHVPDGPVWIRGDRARLLQVFSNLLDNAVKFTPPRGKIAIALRQDGEHIEVSVHDNGPGIPPEGLSDVFGMFVQGGLQSAHIEGGLGLGLSLVQQLVALHGGQVSVFSSGESGKGSEFLVRLPSAPAPDAVVPVERTALPPSPRHILIVDDNHDAADTLQARLQESGYRSYTAYDGVSALAAIRGTQFDAVILDIGLPDVGGLDVARMLRAELRDPPPFIALTGYGQEGDMAATRSAGFHVHLTKPLLGGEIERTLSQLFNKADS